MKTFVTAIPLFNKNMVVSAYKLCDHNSERLLGTSFDFQMLGESLTTRGLDLIEKIGMEPFTNGLSMFVDVNQYHLLMDVPTNLKLPPKKLICIVPKNLPYSDVLAEKYKTLRKMGYRMAISDKPASAQYGETMSVADYLFVDCGHPLFSSLLDQVTPYARSKIIVITGIPDRNAFERLSSIPNALFGGKFYEQPISEGTKEISPIKVNALELLRQIYEDDVDLIRLSNIIERDPAISISLLRLINSPGVGVSRRVESVRTAVTILGQLEIKRWITVTISVRLAKDRPGEITKLSLVRAKFAENIALARGKNTVAPSLFTTGLFSLLDIILDMPMERAVREVALSAPIQQALVEKTGELYPIMELIYAYERADWDAVSISMIQNDLKAEIVIQSYIDALQWYKGLLSDIDHA